MIPPADGLNEKQLGLLWNIINELNEEGFLYYTFIHKASFKDLCEFGVIGVATVNHHPWQQSYDSNMCKDGYKVWVTEKGHKYMRGEINVSKPCNLKSYYSGICKRHKRRHTNEERGIS